MLTRLLGGYLSELNLRPAAAPEERPAVRYADYVAMEREALASEEENQFWRDATNG